jgi:hypothetical protein
MSLSHTQKVCNNVFKEQTKKLAKNMRDPNVINYVRHLLRGVNAGIRDSKNRKKRSVFRLFVYEIVTCSEPGPVTVHTLHSRHSWLNWKADGISLLGARFDLAIPKHS